MSPTSWFLYIVQCQDGSLYTGITTDLTRRLFEHNNDDRRGAKSTKYKRPVKLVYSQKYDTQSDARKREVAIKNWKREYKLKLINKGNL